MLRISRDASEVPRSAKVINLATLDQRTREYRLMQETRADLLAHVGNMPSATQLALIERACQLRLRIAVMDQSYADQGTMTEHDSRVYLAWSNAYVRVVTALGLKAPPRPKQDLQGYLSSRYGRVRDVGEDGATTRATNGHAPRPTNGHAAPASRAATPVAGAGRTSPAANGAKPPTASPRERGGGGIARRTLA